MNKGIDLYQLVFVPGYVELQWWMNDQHVHVSMEPAAAAAAAAAGLTSVVVLW